MRTLPILFLLGLLVGCPSSGDDDGGGGGVDAAPLEEPVPPVGYTLTPFLSPEPERTFAAAIQVTEAGQDYVAVIETDQGRIVLDLLETETPITVNSFVWLALHHFYDGIAFHRVIDGFVGQAGDPNTLLDDRSNWGEGGPGYMFSVEIVAGLSYDGAGVVGMARAEALDTNGSQFFITLDKALFLDGDYTIFARVTEGLEVLPALVRGEPPTTPTRMRRVFIAQKAK